MFQYFVVNNINDDEEILWSKREKDSLNFTVTRKLTRRDDNVP